MDLSHQLAGVAERDPRRDGAMTINEFLADRYEEVYAATFYRDIFPAGELDIWRDSFEDLDDDEHKYCAIAVEKTDERKPNGDPKVKRYTLTDDRLEEQVRSITWDGNFCFMSPISYIGKHRDAEHARDIYALAFDVDNLITKKGQQTGLRELIYEWEHTLIGHKTPWLPKPTYIVASGNGVHLYYLLDHPLPLFKNIAEQLGKYKEHLTWKMWNRNVTYTHEEHQIQYEPIWQGFRMVGGVTKDKKGYVRAYRVGERVSVDYLNSFINRTIVNYEMYKIVDVYRSTMSLAEAAQKYPEWYQKRIIEQRPRGSYIVSEKVYDWWLEQIRTRAVCGKRYWCIFCLVVYALKCGIEYDRVRRDALDLVPLLDERTEEEDNHFTEEDVMVALQAYKRSWLVRYRLSKIEYRSGIKIKRNRRNGRKRTTHLKIARGALKALNEEQGYALQGRPIMGDIIIEWRRYNTSGSKADCIRDTGLSKKTVYKWWDKYNPDDWRDYILPQG